MSLLRNHCVRPCLRLEGEYMSELEGMEEIEMDILARLPAKTVGACKSVSKHWLRLISDPQFPALHLSWSRKNPKYIICPYPEDSDIVTHLSLMEENGKISENILVSGFENICTPEMTCFLNGLICSVYDDEDNENEVNIRIFNPITQDTILLPKGSPSTQTPTVGVIFDPTSNEFKVFRFYSDSSDKGERYNLMYKCEVYTSTSTEWRMISKNVRYRPEHNPFNPFNPYYVSIAGSMYWLVWFEDEPGSPLFILSVDMNERFTDISLPEILGRWTFLIELEGCLSLVHVNFLEFYSPEADGGPNPFVEVYKFENCEWHSRSEGVISVPNFSSVNSVAARDNELFFIIRLEDDSFCYITLDLDEGSTEELDLSDSFEGYSPVAFPFVESLLKCSRT